MTYKISRLITTLIFIIPITLLVSQTRPQPLSNKTALAILDIYNKGYALYDFTDSLTVLDEITLNDQLPLAKKYGYSLKLYIIQASYFDEFQTIIKELNEYQMVKDNDVLILVSNKGIKFLINPQKPPYFFASLLDRSADAATPYFQISVTNRSQVGVGLEHLIKNILVEYGHGSWVKNRWLLTGIITCILAPILGLTFLLPFLRARKYEFNQRINVLKMTLQSKETRDLKVLETYKIGPKINEWLDEINTMQKTQHYIKDRTQLNRIYDEVKVALKLPSNFFPKQES